MNLDNTPSAMVQLWLRLERTAEELLTAHRRFCPRNVIRLWLSHDAPHRRDEFERLCREVCRRAELEGYEELPPVRYFPRKHRELLRAFIAAVNGIGMRQVNTGALDTAFTQAFPHATPLNIQKRKREDGNDYRKAS